MNGIKVSVVADGSVAWLRLEERVTLEFGEVLKSAGMFLLENGAKSLKVEMSSCTFMDSTIMGVLTMIALEGYKREVQVEAINATKESQELLVGLGVHKVIKFTTDDLTPTAWSSPDIVVQPSLETSVILDAHKTLMEVDSENVAKFAAVVKCLENE